MVKLCMEEVNCIIVEKLPNKLDIKYIVQPAPDTMAMMLYPLIEDVQAHGKCTKKTIVFCKSYTDYVEVSVSELHNRNCFLVESLDGSKQPVCEMYSASTAEDVKDAVLQSFTDPKGHVCIVVATIAFGMGLDTPDVRQSIHLKPSDTIQAYVQETGRCGRDGQDSIALLYYRNKDVSKASSASSSIKAYCTNKELCRRQQLMKEFDASDAVVCPEPIHKCCDVCEQNCTCRDHRVVFQLTEGEVSETVAINVDDYVASPVKKRKKKNTQNCTQC